MLFGSIFHFIATSRNETSPRPPSLSTHHPKQPLKQLVSSTAQKRFLNRQQSQLASSQYRLPIAQHGCESASLRKVQATLKTWILNKFLFQLNLLTFGLWGKLGRLTHYAVDAVLSTPSFASPNTCLPTSSRDDLATNSSMNSFHHSGRHETLHWSDVSKVLGGGLDEDAAEAKDMEMVP